MYSTLKIDCSFPKNKKKTGTGFVFCTEGNMDVIVTNRHVIDGSLAGEFIMTEGDRNNQPLQGHGIKVVLDRFSERWIPHPSPEVDLAVMPILQAVRQAKRQHKTPFFTRIESSTIPEEAEWEEFIPLEDILMIGYPRGLWDEVNYLSFFRKGITVTNPGINYKGKDEFVLQNAIYPGSSGSPVFRLTQDFYTKSRRFEPGPDSVRLLGVAYKHLLMVANGKIISEADLRQHKVSSKVLIDLGIAIRSTRLRDFEPILEQQGKILN
jgi:hypothetical protein